MLSPVEEIKSKLDIVDVISGYIKLQKAGRYLKANCPFHSEKTPSFFVTPERQIWRCFGCGKGGDIFSFVKEIEGLDFAETLRILAQRAGVALKRQNPSEKSEKQRLFEICELAAKFFVKQIENSVSGKKIKMYLFERGISEESIGKWRVGFAPDDWHALSRFLKLRGYSEAEIIKSGLVVERGQNSENPKSRSLNPVSDCYDRFRNRIIFPIFDINGRIAGFAGRVAPGEDEKTAKYVNTPQTLIYDKGRLLYGLNSAKMEMRKKDSCVIVEGNTDVIMSQQAGALNTVAVSGTALTEDHLKIIKRYTENVILAFDLDSAGQAATKRAIDMAIKQGMNVRIIRLESRGKIKSDPAEIIRKNPADWLAAISGSQEIVDYYFESVFAQYSPKTVGGKKNIAKIILPLLKKIPNKIEQAHWLQELSHRLGVREKFLTDAIKEIKLDVELRQRRSGANKDDLPKIRPRQDIIEEELAGLVLASSDIKKQLIELESLIKYAGLDKLFVNSILMKLMLDLEKYAKKSKDENALLREKWLAQLPPDLASAANQLIFQIEVINQGKEISPRQISFCAQELKKGEIRKELSEIQNEIRTAEAGKDGPKLSKLLKQFKKRAQELNSV